MFWFVKAVPMTKEYRAELVKARAQIVPSKGEIIRDERKHHDADRVVMDGDREVSRTPWVSEPYRRRA